MPIKSFGLTHVQYDISDPFGPVWALFSLSPIFIMVMFATLIAFRRDFQTIFSVIGQMICVGLNLILKHLTKQYRPVFHEHYLNTNTNTNTALESEYGMPSNHSQFIWHFATFYAMQLLLKCWTLSLVYKVLYACSLITLAFITSYSRYHLHYHTIEQVLVGCVVGSISGFVWYIISNSSATMSRIICRQPWARWLGLRDYTNTLSYPPIDEYTAMTQGGSLKL